MNHKNYENYYNFQKYDLAKKRKELMSNKSISLCFCPIRYICVKFSQYLSYSLFCTFISLNWLVLIIFYNAIQINTYLE